MNSARKMAVLLLLTGLAGCKHKVQTAPPPAAQAPVYPPSAIANKEPAPQLPPAKPADVKPAGSEVAQKPPPPKPAKPAHKRTKSADTTTTTTAQSSKDASVVQTPAAQVASAGQPADASPIGQLSSAGDSASTLSRHDIQARITSTENNLNGIKRTLTSDEQQTATQIRTFLTKAKKALDQDDLDGANTLVTKAQVLLDELTKS